MTCHFPSVFRFRAVPAPRRQAALRTIGLLASLALGLAFGPAARANDGAYGLDAGGLVLQRSYAVQMREEVLHISRQRIDVAYTFTTSPYVTDDQRMLVAFPLPEIPLSDDNGLDVDDVEGLDIVGFEVWVDDRPLTPQIEAKALVAGVDLTPHLDRFGISPSRFQPDFLDRLEGLDDAAKAELADLGLIRWDRFSMPTADGGSEAYDYVSPLWSLKLTYYWWQDFPADRETNIRHSYRPVLGSEFASAGELLPYYGARYCIDEARSAELTAELETAGRAIYIAHDLRYILETAKSWDGPIGAFSLVVELGPDDTAVALCHEGLTRTAPTRYEFHAEDYVPNADLDLLFLVAVGDRDG